MSRIITICPFVSDFLARVYGTTMCYNFIPFKAEQSIVCVYTTFCMSIHLLMGISGCLHILATENNAAMNIVLRVSVLSSSLILLGTHQEVELLDHMVTLYLTFFLKHFILLVSIYWLDICLPF